MRTKSIFVAMLLASAPLPSVAQDLSVGGAAYQREDYATALQEWKPLAEQGDANAQSNLGFMYRDGLGVPQDYVLAHMWFNIAAANGNDSASEIRQNFAVLMTTADISEAQRRARVCMASDYQDCE